ncbi:MAG: Ig-like domain-containing protein [Methanoregulaceae archaeon]|nr:Ig-like domain-containing protein [Methanoregulaceae archaeon]
MDTRKDPEFVTFTILTRDGSRLQNSSDLNFTNITTTNSNNLDGMVDTNISLDTEPGDTLIRVKPLGLADRTIKIERIADGEPFYIYAVRRDPSVPYVPANGEDYFVITYQLFDQYMNVLNNKKIELEAESPGEPWYPNITTTYDGLAAEQYGPFPIEGSPGKGKEFKTKLIATAQENLSVQSILPVEFYDPRPVDLLLSVNPRNIPSLDVNNTSHSVVTGMVVDNHGKGVGGQTVNFSLSSPIYSVLSPQITALPYLTCTLNVTDEYGFAYVTFIPGKFNASEYRSVTGQCDVTGTWNLTSRNVAPIWKNYGYLKVTTWVDNSSIIENQTVKVGVEVYADGPSFNSLPIDMIFSTDRGASMLWDTYDGYGGSGDKMQYLYNNSAVIFNELNECPEEAECDRAGVVSFGPGNRSINWPDKWPGDDVTAADDSSYIASYYPPNSETGTTYIGYEDFATVDTGLEYDFKPLVNDTINGLRPFGDPWKGDKANVPLRYGLYKSINEMIGLGTTEETRPEAIRAIIVLTDPEWNDWGDPTAGWDGISVKTVYAETKKAPWKLPESGLNAWVPFSTFGRKVGGQVIEENNVPIGDIRQNMANYAKEHEIIIYSVAYPKKDNNIDDAREEVLRHLSESTGGMYFEARNGTNLRTIFEVIGRDLRQRASINTTAEFNFTSVKLYTNGTVEDWGGNETFNYSYVPFESTKTQKWNSSGNLTELIYRDDTINWTVDQKLKFDLGTMFVGDRWMANFTLISKKVGTVELFENSYIYTDDDQIIVPKPIIQTGATRRGDEPTADLEIKNFIVTNSLNLDYLVQYTGNETLHTRLFYRKGGRITGDWKQFAARNYECTNGACLATSDDAVISKWLLGSGDYEFKIEAWAKDAPMDYKTNSTSLKRKFYILLR